MEGEVGRLFERMLTAIGRSRADTALASVCVRRPTTGVAHACVWDDGTLVAVHNLGPEPRKVPLTLADCSAEHRLVDLLRRTRHLAGAPN